MRPVPLWPYLQVSELFPQEWKSSVCCSPPSFSWPVLHFPHKIYWQMSKVNQLFLKCFFFLCLIIELLLYPQCLIQKTWNNNINLSQRKARPRIYFYFVSMLRLFSRSCLDFLFNIYLFLSTCTPTSSGQW